MAELRLPGRAGEKVVGPAGRRRGGTWVVWPLPAGLFEMASCAWNSVRSSQMVIACSTWHRVCNYCWLQPLLFFFASVWPVWMFRMLLLCSITPCPDSGLLEGAKMKKETVFLPCQQGNMRLETAHVEASQVSLIVYY